MAIISSCFIVSFIILFLTHISAIFNNLSLELRSSALAWYDNHMIEGI